MKSPSRLAIALSYAGLTVFAFLVLYPLLWVIKMALTPSQAFSLSVSPIPNEISSSNFRDLVTNQDLTGHYLFFHQLFNSVVVSLATMIIAVGLSTTAAYAFSRFTFPGRRTGLYMLLVNERP